jgi:hypothetical protein
VSTNGTYHSVAAASKSKARVEWTIVYEKGPDFTVDIRAPWILDITATCYHLLRSTRDEEPFVDAWVDSSGLQVLSTRNVDAVRVYPIWGFGDCGVGPDFD